MSTHRILLICDEDDEIVRWNVVLEPLELETDHASTHQLVSSPVVTEGHDLIIIDTGDRLNDKALCSMLRPVYCGAILLVVNNANESYLIAGYKAGADDCIVKSAGYLLLRAKIHAWCTRVEKNRSLRGGSSEDDPSGSGDLD
jgi:DNA-binding response OmpR family regulator